MSFYAPLPPPRTKLGHYRILSPSAGIRVSPIVLGASTIGDKWQDMMGATSKESSFKLLDAYYEAGGNFIDTANAYQDEASESFIGEWMELRGNRDQMVIATKYTNFYKRGNDSINIKINYVGNHSKSLYVSVEESLKKLRTTYIDILYVHWWAWDTSVEEVMSALHHLVASRKVLYLDAPAWVVSKANQWARLSGKTPFSIYQGRWSILDRSFERDIIPMARAEGLALAPFQVVGGGRIRTDEEEQRRRETGEKGRMIMSSDWERTEDEKKVCKKLEEIAKEIGAKNITAVAIAYVMHKTAYVFPIIGGRKVEHLHANLEALDITLTPEQIKNLESVLPFDVGFPYVYIGHDTFGTNMLISVAGRSDHWKPTPALPSAA
ncbi:hypothetical protein Clacol_007681 [Clathrus columnatus]|uniref:NADP-dependent oxidoreductase domain-containing protein n=1 Tax=Clathrus columnatus TaxID=1419009 RepID=A0AAV5AFL2_9AGAM|nr:hypothetical protein Clacol_007681 [Clathrus columnatus]